MKVTLPADCGNAPRVSVVADLVAAWARRDPPAVAEWLAGDASWTIVGGEPLRGADVAERAVPADPGSLLEIATIITHGRFASCDGMLESTSGRTAFSHTLRFTGAGKTARIREVRTYLIDAPAAA